MKFVGVWIRAKKSFSKMLLKINFYYILYKMFERGIFFVGLYSKQIVSRRSRRWCDPFIKTDAALKNIDLKEDHEEFWYMGIVNFDIFRSFLLAAKSMVMLIECRFEINQESIDSVWCGSSKTFEFIHEVVFSR
jgi:hypothetical protein